MRINEIFYSLQGEGFFTGTPAVFIRFSGCNLQCDFCDTTHQSFTDMSEDEIVQQAANYAGRHVVITGGEPSLQLTASLVDKLHAAGKFVAIETNGTHPLPHNIDWITLSPKDAYVAHGAKIVLSRCHEIKLVYDGRPLPSYPQSKCHIVFCNHATQGMQKRTDKSLPKPSTTVCNTPNGVCHFKHTS